MRHATKQPFHIVGNKAREEDLAFQATTSFQNQPALKTMLVEVRVMKIDNRQVTQAVFKQFQPRKLLRSLLGPWGELVSDPWGYVNYHWDCAHYNFSHLHIVWKDGAAICRGIMADSPFMYNKGRISGVRSMYQGDIDEMRRYLRLIDDVGDVGVADGVIEQNWTESYRSVLQLGQIYIAV